MQGLIAYLFDLYSWWRNCSEMSFIDASCLLEAMTEGIPSPRQWMDVDDPLA
jgi:hypothetical protein